MEVAGAWPRDLVGDAEVGEAEFLGGVGEVADGGEVVFHLSDGE